MTYAFTPEKLGGRPLARHRVCGAESRLRSPLPLIAGASVALALTGCGQPVPNVVASDGMLLVRICDYHQSIVRDGNQFFYVEPGKTAPIGPGVPLNDICRARE